MQAVTDPDPDIQARIAQMRANLAETLAAADHEPRPSPPPILGGPPRPARMSRVILGAHRDAIGRRRRHPGRL